MESELRVGEQRLGAGQRTTQRAGNQGDTIGSNLHGFWYEQNLQGRLFSFGISSTALVAANAIATGLTASAQPIIGLYNPLGSDVNLEVAYALLHETVIANTAVATGGYMWLSSTGNNAISTGSSPINCKTLAAAGSSAKAFACATPLTGMTTSLAVIRPAAFWGINAAGPATAITQPQGPGVEFVDGGFVVPPGGVLAIMNQVSTTTVSVNSGIVWAEVPRP